MPLRNFIIIAAVILFSFACYSVAAKNRYANIFAEALELAEKEALYPQSGEKLFVSGMDGMLKTLDEHSVFIYGKKYQDMENDISQQFGGVGLYLEVDQESKKVFVLAAVPGTPAFEAGIQTGDVITQVDQKEVGGLSQAQVTELLRGPVNQPVKITLLRDGASLERELIRATINTPSVYGDVQNSAGKWSFQLRDYPRIGYIRLNIFGEKSSEEMKQAIETLPEDLDGLILDIRDNSGGLLKSAIEICDFFLPPQKLIVSVRRRDGKTETELSKNPPLVKEELPVMVLINRYSASASEVLAGCLQDHGRAIIVGEQSFGKATVQNCIRMQRGQSALKLTTASYRRPSGKPIDRKDEAFRESKKWGIQPDPGFEVKITEADMLNVMRDRNIKDLEGLVGTQNGELLETVKRLRRQMFESLREKLKDQDQPGPEDDPEATDATVQESTDSQVDPYIDATLQRAIEHLQTLANNRQ